MHTMTPKWWFKNSTGVEQLWASGMCCLTHHRFVGGADRHDSLIATIAKLQTPLGITRYVWPKGSIAFSMSDKRSFLSVAIGAPLRQ